MKVTQTLENGITIHAEGSNAVEVFEQLAELTEVFGEPNAVKGEETGSFIFRVRTVGSDKFYELYSTKLRAKLPYGVSKAEPGKLYPKRIEVDKNGKAVKDENDKAIYLKDRGWLRWNPKTKTNE